MRVTTEQIFEFLGGPSLEHVPAHRLRLLIPRILSGNCTGAPVELRRAVLAAKATILMRAKRGGPR